jgi:Holliday junction resolvase
MINLYAKGARKERSIVNYERESGNIAFRSAGSHSPIDVCIINKAEKLIRFVQCKSDNMPDSQKKKLIEEQIDLPGDYKVSFEVL